MSQIARNLTDSEDGIVIRLGGMLNYYYRAAA